MTTVVSSSVTTAGPLCAVPGAKLERSRTPASTDFPSAGSNSFLRSVEDMVAGAAISETGITSGTSVKVLTDQTVISGGVPSTVRSNRAAYSSAKRARTAV